jgi:hypothetical protein
MTTKLPGGCSTTELRQQRLAAKFHAGECEPERLAILATRRKCRQARASHASLRKFQFLSTVTVSATRSFTPRRRVVGSYA